MQDPAHLIKKTVSCLPSCDIHCCNVMSLLHPWPGSRQLNKIGGCRGMNVFRQWLTRTLTNFVKKYTQKTSWYPGIPLPFASSFIPSSQQLFRTTILKQRPMVAVHYTWHFTAGKRTTIPKGSLPSPSDSSWGICNNKYGVVFTLNINLSTKGTI